LEVNLGDRSDFQMIVGLKFLARYNITFDCANKKIADIQACTKKSIMAKGYRNFLKRFNCEKNEHLSSERYGPKG
jgi:hypothetical protein